jgi:hypothetical protein
VPGIRERYAAARELTTARTAPGAGTLDGRP